MSLVALANHHLAVRRQRSQEDGAVRAASAPPPKPDDPAAFNSKVSSALEMLSRYIPTEVVALYLAALGIAPAAGWKTAPLYWIGVAANPIVLLLVYLSNARKGRKPFPPVGQWPWWKAFAATVAFAIWALAIPSAPYITPPTGTLIVGFAAVAASYALSLLGNIIDPA
jgi:hypothetical protein